MSGPVGYAIQLVDSTIEIIGQLKHHVYALQRLVQLLDIATQEKRYTEVGLDFSRCDGVTAAVMLPFTALVVAQRHQGVNFQLQLPDGAKRSSLARLFQNTNWAGFIDPESFQTRPPYRGGHVSARQFFSHEDASPVVDQALELVLSNVCNVPRKNLSALEWAMQEITDNVPIHAQSEVGGFFQATAYAQGSSIEFVVADAGIGIPGSLNGSAKPEEALLRAIEEGYTRDKVTYQGNGLFGSYQIAVHSKGSFEIYSGEGHLVSDKGTVSCKRAAIPYAGTYVRCRMRLDTPNLLARALQFDGKPHVPAFDYIEHEYEGDDGQFVFRIAEKAKGMLGSREGGRKVRRTIENLLQDGGRIDVDFSGVYVISSSFADEVFGRLFVTLGPVAFMNRVRITHVDPTVRGLIDTAIQKRIAADGSPKT